MIPFAFITGMVVGGLLGVVLMGVLYMARSTDDEGDA